MTGQPANAEAEEHVVGAVMLDEHAIEACADLLDGHEFYRETNGLIYRAALAMWRDGHPVDAITLAATLDRDGTLAQAGGKERIHEIATLVPSTGNAAHYARIVREAWAKRLLADFFARGKHAAENGASPASILEGIEKRAIDLRGLIERGQRQSVLTTGQLADNLEAELADPPAVSRGVAVPFRGLRRLQPGRLYILAGYTKHGKTVYAAQQIRAACADGARVGVFSIEMTREQLFDRLVASYGVPLTQVEERRVGDHYKPAVARALAETKKFQAEINDDRSANSATFRRWQKLRRYDLLVIDHLHEIDVPGRAADHRVNLETETLRIASVARDLEVPILLLAQLSRVGNDFPRPTTNALRETGRIEQVAAQVMFIWRTSDEAGLPQPESELIVAADRFGKPGKIPLYFDGECVRFTETLEER